MERLDVTQAFGGSALINARTRAEAARPRPFLTPVALCADQPVRYELNGHLAVGVHGEMRMERDKGPRPIRPVRYGSKVVRVGLDEHVAVLDGPDAFRIAIPKVRRVGRTGPVDGNRYSLAVHDLVEVQRPCLLEEREVHDPMAVGGYGVELASAEERLGEALRERKDVRTRNRWLRPSSPGSSQRQASSRPH